MEYEDNAIITENNAIIKIELPNGVDLYIEDDEYGGGI